MTETYGHRRVPSGAFPTTHLHSESAVTAAKELSQQQWRCRTPTRRWG